MSLVKLMEKANKELAEENKALREALEDIAKVGKEIDPELSSEDSYGNYDDVFYDGMIQGEYYVSAMARSALKHIKKT